MAFFLVHDFHHSLSSFITRAWKIPPPSLLPPSRKESWTSRHKNIIIYRLYRTSFSLKFKHLRRMSSASLVSHWIAFSGFDSRILLSCPPSFPLPLNEMETKIKKNPQNGSQDSSELSMNNDCNLLDEFSSMFFFPFISQCFWWQKYFFHFLLRVSMWFSML